MNAFPPLHAFNSSRGWFLALIVLLHAGFFWVLTHGVTIGSVKIEPKMVVDFLPEAAGAAAARPRQIESSRPSSVDLRARSSNAQPAAPSETPTAPHADHASTRRRCLARSSRETPGAGPLIVEPQGDPRFPFTEPEYPVSEIRLGHEGTVWLSIEILPTGRVGLVRIDQSSGFVKLDDSAVREARRWRMKPGMQDGIATAMWKRVPVTFQLKN